MWVRPALMGVFAFVRFPCCGPSSHYRSDVFEEGCETTEVGADAKWMPWVRAPVLGAWIIAKVG